MVIAMNARGWLALRVLLTVVVLAGLAVDVYVHFDLASSYVGVKSSTLNQGDLFRAEAILALIAGIALLVRPRRYTAAFAFLVTAGGTAAVLLYRYVDVGAFGPLPNMYENIWYTGEDAERVGRRHRRRGSARPAARAPGGCRTARTRPTTEAAAPVEVHPAHARG